MIEFAYSSVIFMAHFAMYFDDFTRENIRLSIADFEQFVHEFQPLKIDTS